MKPLFILLSLFVVTGSTKEQSNLIRATNSNRPDKHDTLTSNDFTFHGYHIYDSLSPEEFSRLRKTANSIKYDTGTNYYEDEFGLYFKKSVIWFYYKSTHINSFELHDNSFAFVVKGKQIKIGEDITPVKHMFPISYAQKYPFSSDNKDTLVNVHIGDYESLLFYIRSNKIKCIEYWVDNS